MQALLERILGRPMMAPAGEGEGGGEDAAPAGGSDAPAPAGDDQVRDDDAPVEGDSEGGEEGEPVEGEEGDAAAQAAAEILKEIEIDGKKLKYSPELHDYLLRQADYSQKTAQVAEEQRAVAAERERMAALFSKERVAKVGELINAEATLQQFRDLPWDQWRAEGNPLAHDNSILWQQWRERHLELSRDVQNLDAQEHHDRQLRALEAERAAANRIQQAQTVLQRNIPNWSQVGPKVAEFAMNQYGYTVAQLNSIDDARFGKMMHQAWLGHELAQKQKTAAQQRTAPKLVTEVAPLVTVGAKSGGPTGRKSLPDIAKTDDMKSFVATWEKTYPAKSGRR